MRNVGFPGCLSAVPLSGFQVTVELEREEAKKTGVDVPSFFVETLNGYKRVSIELKPGYVVTVEKNPKLPSLRLVVFSGRSGCQWVASPGGTGGTQKDSCLWPNRQILISLSLTNTCHLQSRLTKLGSSPLLATNCELFTVALPLFLYVVYLDFTGHQ